MNQSRRPHCSLRNGFCHSGAHDEHISHVAANDGEIERASNRDLVTVCR
jgi:hypothetical protein